MDPTTTRPGALTVAAHIAMFPSLHNKILRLRATEPQPVAFRCRSMRSDGANASAARRGEGDLENIERWFEKRLLAARSRAADALRALSAESATPGEVWGAPIHGLHTDFGRFPRHRAAELLHRQHRPQISRHRTPYSPRREAGRHLRDRQTRHDGAEQPPARIRALRAKAASFDDLHRGGWDPVQRLEDQDRDGVAAEIIYPTVGMPLCNHEDADYKKACFDGGL